MEMKINKVSDNTIELTLEDEDFSIADIIHQELLKNSKVVFAGISPSHPLIKRYVAKIQTVRNVKPISAVVSSGKSAAKTAAEILNAVDKALGGRGEVK